MHTPSAAPRRRTRSAVRASLPLWLPVLLALLLLAPPSRTLRAQSAGDPEKSGTLRKIERVTAKSAMAVTANSYATRAAVEMLRSGGNAVDAAATAQWVLNVVEPQSSGLGGGGFLLAYLHASGEVVSLDGRETAPAAATPERFLGPDGKPLKFYPDRITGGRAVGVPGLLAMLALALERYGTRSLAETLQPAIRLAEEGFPVSPRMAASLEQQRERLARFPATRAVFFGPDGKPLGEGALLRQPDLARAFRLIAGEGAEAFYRGAIATALVQAVRKSPVAPGDLTTTDLANYRAKVRPPVRSTYREYTLYGMGPPSSGATTVFQMLGLLETQPVAPDGPLSVAAVHHFAQAARLAYADRARYLGDPDFVPVPVAGLLDASYLAKRAATLDWDAPLVRVAPGVPPGVAAAQGSQRSDREHRSTTHLTIADAQGNVVAMTNTIEQAFGSGIVVPGYGFLLNNELTDFAARPVDADGLPVANRVQPGKRPRSSMAPTLVLKDGRPVLAIGSPGGSRIIQYVAEVLLRTIDYAMPLQDAIEAPHHTHSGGRTALEPPLAEGPLTPALERLGHRVEVRAQGSGLHGIAFAPPAGSAQGAPAMLLHGGVDPRREGLAAGY